MSRTIHQITSEQPRYQHDCEKCVWLGRYNEYDLYACGKPSTEGNDEILEKVIVNSIIARRSSKPEDYKSGTCFAFSGKSPELEQALARVVLMSYQFVISDEIKSEAWRFLVEKQLLSKVC